MAMPHVYRAGEAGEEARSPLGSARGSGAAASWEEAASACMAHAFDNQKSAAAGMCLQIAVLSLTIMHCTLLH